VTGPWLDTMFDVIDLFERHQLVTPSQATAMRDDCQRLDDARGEAFFTSLRSKEERIRQMTRWQRFKRALRGW
jgi:hypothetical protein